MITVLVGILVNQAQLSGLQAQISGLQVQIA